MENAKKIKVLIVDDSIVFREFFSMAISSDSEIEVVATAKDAFDAREKLLQYRPDVMICDVEMPKMNGIEFIRKLMPQYPIPVIIVSSVCNSVFEALNAGAVDFIPKPDFGMLNNVQEFVNDMIKKLRLLRMLK